MRPSASFGHSFCRSGSQFGLILRDDDHGEKRPAKTRTSELIDSISKPSAIYEVSSTQRRHRLYSQQQLIPIQLESLFIAMSTPAVESLEQRIAALEVGGKYDATQEQVHKVEMEFLQKLKEIRAQIVAEQGDKGGNASSAEVEKLKEANAKLKQQNEKLAYRVKHVVASLNALLDEKKEQTK